MVAATKQKTTNEIFHDAYIREGEALTGWKVGDRVTPTHRPGSRVGRITGINPRNKKTPLLVRFDGEETDGKWGSEAVIAADGSDLAVIETPTESITTKFKVGDRVITPAKNPERVYTIQETGDDDCLVTFRDAKGFERKNWLPISELAIAPSLITTAQNLWAEIDQAIAVADQAEYSALDSARLCGETLLQLKAETPHGQWETVRSQIVHPRTGKAMPSQTATLYQRISEKWEILKAENVRGIKQADEALRRLKPAKEPPEPKTPTVGEIAAAKSPYDYIDIDHKPVWLLELYSDTWIEGKAVAKNGRGFIQVLWGEGKESSFPSENLKWSNPGVSNPGTDRRDHSASGKDSETAQTSSQNEGRNIQRLPSSHIPTDCDESGGAHQRGADLPAERNLSDANDELSGDQKALLSQLKEIASIKSAEIYSDLGRLASAEPDDLVAIADELETAILEILESRFL